MTNPTINRGNTMSRTVRHKSVRYLKLLGGAALASLIATPALAQTVSSGTAAGTDINNSATVTYAIGGATQTSTSNVATFKVDRKVNLQVAEVGNTATTTSVSAADAVTTFTVTNLTNGTQDFLLDVDQQDISIPIVGTDDFNVTGIRIYVDDGDKVFNPAKDTLTTFIDALPQDQTRTVFVVANVPSTANIHNAIVSLRATVAVGDTAGAGLALQQTSLLAADTPGAVDIVFADDAGPLDLARNGQDRAFDAYTIDTAAVAVLKSSRVISDPVNLVAFPKAIPGATMEYCLAVSNAGPGIATGVVVSDLLPTTVTYVPNSLRVGGISVTGGCTLDGLLPEDNDTIGADETDLYGGSFDGTTIRATLPAVTPLLPLNVSFLVTIN
jgi:uncharacterized repeat protein (TIGR01451 family)